jgi:ribonucleoside-diphosphate reductase alpha chain
MALLRVDHPDIDDFIAAKRTPGRLENFNLSVGITDEFLAAVDQDAMFPLRSPRTGRVVARVSAPALLARIVDAAWECGDPGLLFLDEINRCNPTPSLGAIEATNPCGEQPLLPYESCVLGSINLAAFVRGRDVDWPALAEVIRDAVVFLDNVVEASCHPVPEIASATRQTRKIGLGVMGLAEMLARLSVPYDSEPGVAFGARIAEFLARTARTASAELAERRGSFPAFAESIWPGRGVAALRNATVTCVAPTGTMSLLAGTSGGIEPYFALATERRVLDGRTFVDVSRAALDALDQFPAARPAALEELLRTGSLKGVAALPEDVRRSFPIALEIAPEMHVRMQAAFQAHVDAAVSKTVNLPSDAPPSAVRQVFDLARQLRLKGVTVYRYGSRPGQILSLLHQDAQRDCRECAV